MRKRSKARTLVTAQFTLLGVISITALLAMKRETHTYIAFESLVILCGTLVLLFAWKALRPSLQISPIPKDGAIFISRGIYKYVRHPMYLSVILIGLGMAGYADNPVAWISELALILLLNVKATFEDGMLREKYPEAWHYQRHTSKVLPCLGGSCRDNCVN